jgi:Na+/proline symporter
MQMIVGLALFAVAFSVQLLPMTIDVLFVRRRTRHAAIAGLLCGLVVAFCFTPLFPPLFSDGSSPLLQLINKARSIAPIHASAWGLATNIVVFVAISLLQGSAVIGRDSRHDSDHLGGGRLL